ncbi:ABC transporter permease [Thomasclavelia sp.]
MKGFMTLLKTEGKLSLRCPDSLIFGVGMPVGVLFLISIIAGNQNVAGEEYTFLQGAFASLITVGICATAFMGLPITFANYRDKKILKHFFVTPVNPMMMLIVQMILGAMIASLSAIIITICSVFIFNYQMNGNLVLFIGAYFLVMLSMFSMAMIIASLCPSVKVANVVCTFVYFPMLFLSGATIPFEIFPAFIQKIANILPLTHGIQLLKNISIGIYNQEMIFSTIFLFVLAVIGCIISIKVFKWE